MDILNFSDEVLAVIAAHLPPKMRLTNFSLAHSRLGAAADHATTTQLSFSHTFERRSLRDSALREQWEDVWYNMCKDPRGIPDYRRECCDSFANWLLKHGQHLTRLRLTNFNMELNSPLPALKELELYGCSALWHDEDDFSCCDRIVRADIPNAFTSLTKLHMGICTFDTETYQQVAALTNLQHFTFSSPVRVLGYGCRGPPADLQFGFKHEPCLSSDFFRTLTNLTHLELHIAPGPTGKPVLTIDGCEKHKNASQHLSCLVKLQTLILTTGSISSRLAEGLTGLNSMTALTRLHLGPSIKCVAYQPDGTMGIYCGTSWLKSLTALQWLCLERVGIEPSQLHGLSQLACLYLVDVFFDPASLLELLGNLTRLQQLHIIPPTESGWAEHYPFWPAPSEAYAGLTASSKLQEVVLDHGWLPAGVWPHAFPAGRLLPELRSLYARCQQLCQCWQCQHAAVGAGPGGEAGQHAGSSLACITAACPRLERLCVW